MSNKYEEVIKSIEDELKKLSEKDEEILKEINEDCKSKIEHFISMSEEMDARRTEIHNFSVNYLMLLVMIATLIFGVINDQWKYIPLIAIGFQILLAVFVIYKYYKQAGCNYIFKSSNLQNYSNKSKWFYYGNPNISKINLYPKKEDIESEIHYLNGLELLINTYNTSNLIKDVSDNLIQLYLLQVHNYYKNKFYGELTSVYQYIIHFLILGVVLGFIIA